MIKELATHLDDFPGPANQTRCFLHILNLTAKSILKQFDEKNGPNDIAGDNVVAQALDVEQEEYKKLELNDEDMDDRPLDLWVNFEDGWSEEDREEIRLSTQPVRLMLTKVRVT